MIKEKQSRNKICGRLCVELSGNLASPLSIGSGEESDTDADVILNVEGVPYIPGSTLAGTLRSYGMAMWGENRTNELFGAPLNGRPGSKEDRESRIFFYDTVLQSAQVGIRDGVKLDENKVSVHMAKYEQQIVESGARFKIRIEIIEREDCFQEQPDMRVVWNEDKKWFQLWIQGFSRGELRIGAKSRRGFGRIKIEQVKYKKFDMREKDTYLKWLDWDWDQNHAFDELEGEDIGITSPIQHEVLEHTLEVPLCIQGSLLIRSYRVDSSDDYTPDYVQITEGNKDAQAIIPGSSWAGAFRSHIAKIIQELAKLSDWQEAQKRLDPFFGTWTVQNNQKQNMCASKITFEETVVKGGNALPTARIAVDRFTGGTVNGALFETQPWAGGTGLLRIRWKKFEDSEGDDVICGMLMWAVMDLLSGILPVGGETAIGRGICCQPDQGSIMIRKDGMQIRDKERDTWMRAAALWVRGEDNNGII